MDKESKLRPAREIQDAHDILFGIGWEHVDLGLNEEQLKALRKCVTILAWVLGQPAGKRFAELVEDMEEAVDNAGFTYFELPHLMTREEAMEFIDKQEEAN